MDLSDDLRTWAAEHLHPWQQSALERIAIRPLDPSDDQHYLTRCKRDAGLLPPSDHLEAPAVQFGSRPPTASAAPIHLVHISEVANVNAIAAKSALKFAPSGLTVVYGQNGTGKSGYA